MHPERKLFQMITLTVVSLMFAVSARIGPESSADNIWARLVIGLGGAFVTYRLLTLALISLSDNSSWALKWILGPRYTKGTWITRSRTKRGKFRILVEHHEQTFSGLVISGCSFTPSGFLDARYRSKTAQIDPKGGMLHAFFLVDVMSKDHPVETIATFTFERKAAHLPPHRMSGYSINVDAAAIRAEDAKANYKIRYDQSIHIDNELIDFEKAFNKAKDVHFADYMKKYEIDDEGFTPELRRMLGARPQRGRRTYQQSSFLDRHCLWRRR